MAQHAHRHRQDDKFKRKSTWAELWDSFWSPPHEHCPRCGNKNVEFYDPFFFSPVRTIAGKRRIKCPQCRFVWRPSSKGRSLLQTLNPFRSY
jgi:transposase-like protein